MHSDTRKFKNLCWHTNTYKHTRIFVSKTEAHIRTSHIFYCGCSVTGIAELCIDTPTMKLSVSAYRAHASAHKKILSSSYQTTLNYGSTAASSSSPANNLFSVSKHWHFSPWPTTLNNINLLMCHAQYCFINFWFTLLSSSFYWLLMSMYRYHYQCPTFNVYFVQFCLLLSLPHTHKRTHTTTMYVKRQFNCVAMIINCIDIWT